MLARITLRNYRCFGDEPQILVLRPGFTAIVGPNNAGKSTLLRFFYEFRQFFGWFVQLGGGPLGPLLRGAHQAMPVNRVPDVAALFCDHTGGDLEIGVQLETDQPTDPRPELFPVHLTFRVRRPTDQTTLVTGGRLAKNRNALTFAPGDDGLVVDGQHRPIAALGPLATFGRDWLDALYIPAFRNVLSVDPRAQTDPYYDIVIGRQLIAEWARLKTGERRQDNDLAQRVTADLARIFGFQRLEINAAQDGETVRAVIDRHTYSLHEIGSGFSQFLVCVVSAAVKRPSYVLIDEPEIHLHPSLQADFLTTLTSYARQGVMFATHSLGLARASADWIYAAQRRADGTAILREYEATPNLAELLGELSYSGYSELGFRRILLVEGATEVRTVQQLLRAYRKDHEILLLPLGGRALIRPDVEIELREIARITPDVWALIDSERNAAGAPLTPEIEGFAATCGRVGIEVCVLERRALENYFPADAIERGLGRPVAALEPYERLRGWPKSHNWRIAREARREDYARTDLGAFLDRLCGEVQRA